MCSSIFITPVTVREVLRQNERIRTSEYEHKPDNAQNVWSETHRHQTLQLMISMISSSTLIEGVLISDMSSCSGWNEVCVPFRLHYDGT